MSFIPLIRRLVRRLLLLMLLAGAAFIIARLMPLLLAPVPDDQPLTLERLQEVAELLTLRIGVEETLVTQIDGYVGGISVTLLVRGDVSLGVDLAQGRLVQVDPSRRRATLVLPPPHCVAPRVDQERSQVLALSRSGLWRMAPTSRPESAVLQAALLDAQHRVEAAAASPPARRRAQAHAAAVLQRFGQSLGWTIDLRWQS